MKGEGGGRWPGWQRSESPVGIPRDVAARKGAGPPCLQLRARGCRRLWVLGGLHATADRKLPRLTWGDGIHSGILRTALCVAVRGPNDPPEPAIAAIRTSSLRWGPGLVWPPLPMSMSTSRGAFEIIVAPGSRWIACGPRASWGGVGERPSQEKLLATMRHERATLGMWSLWGASLTRP